MKLSGEFDTTTSPADLRGLVSAPKALNGVSAFRSVEPREDGSIRVDFAPRISMGWVRLDTVLTPGEITDDRATVHALGMRGSSGVEGDVVISYKAADGGGSTVTWEADLVLLGPAASTGQRVGPAIARRAVGTAIEEAAAAAGGSEA